MPITNKEKRKEYQRKWSEHNRLNLGDAYIKAKLRRAGFKTSEITQDMIIKKREVIRQLRKREARPMETTEHNELTNGNLVKQLFNDHPELLEKLEKRANKNYRDLANELFSMVSIIDNMPETVVEDSEDNLKFCIRKNTSGRYVTENGIEKLIEDEKLLFVYGKDDDVVILLPALSEDVEDKFEIVPLKR